MVVARITVQPGAQFPWHLHPGPVLGTIAEGELVLTNADDCVDRPYPTGTSFVEPGDKIHTARNPTDGETTVIATFLDVPPEGPMTVTEGIEAPGCHDPVGDGFATRWTVRDAAGRGFWVAFGSSRWVLAHELGHVAGNLGHSGSRSILMWTKPSEITSTPPQLTAGQCRVVRHGRDVDQCRQLGHGPQSFSSDAATAGSTTWRRRVPRQRHGRTQRNGQSDR